MSDQPTAATTAATTARPEDDRTAQRRREATARHALRVAALLDRRAELRGLVGLADLVTEGARWAA